MAIDVEVSLVPMQSFAHMVRQPADCQDIARAVERECVLSIKTLAGEHLAQNRLKAWIVGLKRVGGSHYFDDTSGRLPVASGRECLFKQQWRKSRQIPPPDHPGMR